APWTASPTPSKPTKYQRLQMISTRRNISAPTPPVRQPSVEPGLLPAVRSRARGRGPRGRRDAKALQAGRCGTPNLLAALNAGTEVSDNEQTRLVAPGARDRRSGSRLHVGPVDELWRRLGEVEPGRARLRRAAAAAVDAGAQLQGDRGRRQER